jgi:hypothetical protein
VVGLPSGTIAILDEHRRRQDEFRPQFGADFGSDGQQIRAVDEDGQVKRLSDGSGDQMVNDGYLRSQFLPPGKARAPRPGDTPVDLYHNAINVFSQAVERLEETFTAISAVAGDDGRPLVEARGVDSRECSAWRDVLGKIDEELIIWARTFKRVFGTAPEPSAQDFGEEDETDLGERGDVYAQSYEDWDQAGKEGGEQLPAQTATATPARHLPGRDRSPAYYAPGRRPNG